MRALALLLCLLSSQAWGANYYVRGKTYVNGALTAACEHNGDGTAYACAASAAAVGAWNDESNIVFGGAGAVQSASRCWRSACARELRI